MFADNQTASQKGAANGPRDRRPSVVLVLPVLRTCLQHGATAHRDVPAMLVVESQPGLALAQMMRPDG
ncbi:MAG: hypothetical protein JSR26_03355 [Proteobacteria bacterium]|nr:hypothetical protein [Pseudomonadota bacterium]